MKKIITLFYTVLSFSMVYSQNTTVPNCDYKTDEVDEFTGNSKKFMELDEFIRFTSEDLKPYYNYNDYIKCQVSMATINDIKVLYLSWTIQIKNAYKYFGGIVKGSEIILKLENGKIVTLKYSSTEIGDSNYDNNTTSYVSFIILTDSNIESLKNSSVSKVRMNWSKGYEDYPVYNKNVFKNQIRCLNL